MFERFTDRARRAVVAAQEEARSLGHNHIGSEHLLLGLLHVLDGDQADALAAAGITVESARAQVAGLAGPGSKSPGGAIPFTPRAKKVMELSLREALERKSSYIGTEHLLLAVMREADGLGARVVEQLGGSLSALRQRVIETSGEAAPGSATVAGRGGDPELGTRRLLPHDVAREALFTTPETAIDFRRLLTSADHRLAVIERHLGIGAGEEPARGLRRLLTSVDRRLANIERHLGIEPEPGRPAAEPGEPTAEPAGPAAEPGEPATEPGAPGAGADAE